MKVLGAKVKESAKSRVLGFAGCLLLAATALAPVAYRPRVPLAGEDPVGYTGGHQGSAVREIRAGLAGGAVMREVQVGKMPDGYLVTVTWTDSLQLVRLLCLNPQAGGCQRSEKVGPALSHPGYRRQFIVVYGRERISDVTLTILAHEICHAVASAQALKDDPCHNENGGRI